MGSSVLGLVGGVLTSIVGSILMRPVMRFVCGFNVIKVLATLRIQRDDSFDGEWNHTWTIEGSRNFKPRNGPYKLIIYRVGKLFAATTKHRTRVRDGSYDEYEIRMVGVIDTNYITGKWYGARKAKYFGAFQVVIKSGRNDAVGKWVGFKNNGDVGEGDFIWRRG